MLLHISARTLTVFSAQPSDGSNKWDFYMLSLYLYIHINHLCFTDVSVFAHAGMGYCCWKSKHKDLQVT